MWVLSNIKTLTLEEQKLVELINDIGIVLTKLTDEETKIGKMLNDAKALEAQTINKIKTIDASIASKTTRLSTLTQQAAMNKCEKEIKDLEKNRGKEEKLLNDILTKVPDL